MDLRPSEQQRAVCDGVSDFLDKEVTPERVRDAEPMGFDAGVWRGLADMGVPTLGVSEELGGMGAGLLDLALVAEAIGAHLTPAPILETQVSLRAVERVDAGLAGQMRAGVEDSSLSSSLALRPARQGVFELVPGGAVSTYVVGLDGEELVCIEADPPGATGLLSNFGDAPLAHRQSDGGSRTVLARGQEARGQFDAALDEWRVLTAAALVGLGSRAVDLGVEYARSREQFGVPIGSFQVVAHRLADVATEIEGAQLLVHEAAWAVDEGRADAAELACMAYLFACESGQHAAAESLHFHGGYGFTLEYDIQLFHRRAKAWSLALDGRTGEFQNLADRLLAGSLAPSGGN
ncbi:acyl-CoA dehydrogenase family protein [Myxococcota bacterium]|nr:acyl-CoA dehydrogenase family protein [Myxococcota bacterium]